jgi:hypothetical protein
MVFQVSGESKSIDNQTDKTLYNSFVIIKGVSPAIYFENNQIPTTPQTKYLGIILHKA